MRLHNWSWTLLLLAGMAPFTAQAAIHAIHWPDQTEPELQNQIAQQCSMVARLRDRDLPETQMAIHDIEARLHQAQSDQLTAEENLKVAREESRRADDNYRDAQDPSDYETARNKAATRLREALASVATQKSLPPRLQTELEQARTRSQRINTSLEQENQKLLSLKRARIEHQKKTLRAQLQRERPVEATGDAGCESKTLEQCQKEALNNAISVAIDSAGVTYIDEVSEFLSQHTNKEDVEQITQRIRRLRQLTLSHTVVEDGLGPGRRTYFYRIKGKVKGSPDDELLCKMLGGCEPDANCLDQQAEPKTYREPITGIEFIKIDGDRFQMGSPETENDHQSDEEQHKVSVDSFYLGKTEVTNAQYRKFKPSHNSGDYQGKSLNGDDQPVVNVIWEEATAYAEWLSRKSGKKYRLPTEAEWEYAARAGTTTAYHWGNQASHGKANYGKDECCEGLAQGKDRWVVTSPVGRFDPNAFGLHDMLGNVWEWTCSAYDKDYGGSEKQCSSKNDAGARVLRGGSWDDDPGGLRAANRGFTRPDDRYDSYGFRLARDL